MTFMPCTQVFDDESVQKARTEARSRREEESTAQFEAFVSVLDNASQRSLGRAKATFFFFIILFINI